MTAQDIYDKYDRRLYRLIRERETQALAAAFPETGGNDLYVHNWIICGGTAKGREPGQAEKAQAILGDHRKRWQRIRARYERLYAREQHREHVEAGRSGAYLWCDACAVTLTRRGVREYTLTPVPEDCDLGVVKLSRHSEPKGLPWHLVCFGRNFETPELAAKYLADIVRRWNDPPTAEQEQAEAEARAADANYQAGYAYACGYRD